MIKDKYGIYAEKKSPLKVFSRENSWKGDGKFRAWVPGSEICLIWVGNDTQRLHGPDPWRPAVLFVFHICDQKIAIVEQELSLILV